MAYIPKYISDTVTPGPYFKIITDSKIEFDADYSSPVYPIDIRVYQGQSVIDTNGNLSFALKAKLNTVILQSPNSVKWLLGVTNNGELAPDSGATGSVDPLRIARDGDNVVCEIQIDNNGLLAVEDAPTPGVVVESLHLVSPNGLAWKIGITQSNLIYIEDGIGNKFSLTDDLGNVLFQMNETLNGAINNQKYFSDKSLLPNPPTLVSGTIPSAYAYDSTLGKVVEFIYTNGAWSQLVIKEQTTSIVPYGTIISSILTQTQMDVQNPGYYLCDGRSCVGTTYGTLYSQTSVPDMRNLFIRGKNNGRIDPLSGPELALGATQMDAFQGHNHTTSANMNGQGGSGSMIPTGAGYKPDPTFAPYVIDNSVTNNSFPRVENETRPKHIVLNYFIKVN